MDPEQWDWQEQRRESTPPRDFLLQHGDLLIPAEVWHPALATPGQSEDYWYPSLATPVSPRQLHKDLKAPGSTAETTADINSGLEQDTATSQRRPRRIQPEAVPTTVQPAAISSYKCQHCGFSLAEAGGHRSEYCPFIFPDSQYFSTWFRQWNKSFNHTSATSYQQPRQHGGQQ